MLEICFLKVSAIKNLFSKMENGQFVENLFPEKMTRDLLKSYNLSKFGSKQLEKKFGQK